MTLYFLRDLIKNRLAFTRLPVGKVGVVGAVDAEVAFNHLEPGDKKSDNLSTIRDILRCLVGAGADLEGREEELHGLAAVPEEPPPEIPPRDEPDDDGTVNPPHM